MSTSSAIIYTLEVQNHAAAGNLDIALGGTAYYQNVFKTGSGSGTFTYFQSTANDPEYCVPNGGSADYGSSRIGTVHVPLGAVPQLNSDHHMNVFDHVTGRHWEFWESGIPAFASNHCNGLLQMPGNDGTDPGNSAPSPATNDFFALGDNPPPTLDGIGMLGTAGGISMEWDVRPQDVLAGKIPHALSFVTGCDAENASTKQSAYVYPTIKNRANGAGDNRFYCNSGTNMPYGAHLWLDVSPTTAQRNTFGCDILSWAMLTALHQYGAYMNDVSTYNDGGVQSDDRIGWNMMSDLNDTYTGNPNGTTSYWQQVFNSMAADGDGGPYSTNNRYQFHLQTCNISMVNHLHILIPPTPN